MDDQIAVKVSGVGKTFRLPHEKTTSVKGAVINFWRRNRSYETQEVLKDISFDIKKGEFFGIAGRNGGGKSTLLKLLAGIYSPSKGSVRINGKLTPFIELGVGFNYELSGRENVFLNGALLGFSRREMAAMYQDIVDFAELERFMDQKLKNYSSGMQVRLAFSIAIRAQSDILLLDEVLAVGDAAFQQKCFDVFSDLKKQGTTIIFVTHDMGAVLKFCDRAILIEDGNLRLIGRPSIVAEEYLALNYEEKPISDDPAAKASKTKPHITGTTLTNKNGAAANTFDPGQECIAAISYEKPTDKPIHLGFQIYSSEGDVYCFGTNSKIDGVKALTAKKGTLKFCTNLQLTPGNYYITTATLNDDATALYNYRSKIAEFRIKKSTEQGGVALMPHRWESKHV